MRSVELASYGCKENNVNYSVKKTSCQSYPVHIQCSLNKLSIVVVREGRGYQINRSLITGIPKTSVIPKAFFDRAVINVKQTTDPANRYSVSFSLPLLGGMFGQMADVQQPTEGQSMAITSKKINKIGVEEAFNASKQPAEIRIRNQETVLHNPDGSISIKKGGPQVEIIQRPQYNATTEDPTVVLTKFHKWLEPQLTPKTAPKNLQELAQLFKDTDDHIIVIDSERPKDQRIFYNGPRNSDSELNL